MQLSLHIVTVVCLRVDRQLLIGVAGSSRVGKVILCAIAATHNLFDEVPVDERHASTTKDIERRGNGRSRVTPDAEPRCRSIGSMTEGRG
jgi:hypothetical protein